ncbi:Transcriptional regulator, TetR family [uncultured Pleomorphomonas sp.]|uniref:Transcriptional regulator, TetR family n=1 Tax=uncultured Pleomorphomonas sp. TaxID=442121 RepID=A0A212LQM1_9HYPH|nr:TetR/AcrR family transcriptional regulator [uncultured Pleomorphomonas sp.]SCM79719.1 Transcriptional regulator, TetR family [uncultured Pleomorphomonas sp.]
MDQKQQDNGKGPQAAPRPGGRAARIQAAIFKAVEELKRQGDAADLTVPAIAARAGVTPSTIYRRWGTLAELLSDVAVKQLRPDAEPADSGDWRADLKGWLEQYAEEMASEPGRAMLREVLGADRLENAGVCSAYTSRQLDVIRARALARGDRPPDTAALMDRVIAPVIYRILFSRATPDAAYVAGLIEEVLGEDKT